MQQIRIGRKDPVRQHRDRDAVLPLDPRDPDILRAKLLLRRGRRVDIPQRDEHASAHAGSAPLPVEGEFGRWS